MKDHAALVVHDRAGRILFIQRSLKKKTLPGAWSFPSGTCEEGETVAETAVREAREELGLDVRPEPAFATHELAEFGVRLHFIACTILGGEPALQDKDELQAIRWMTFSEFFATFTDQEIGHGLIWLRTQPELLAQFELQTA